MKYNVQGEDFKNKTALQRAWRTKLSELCKRVPQKRTHTDIMQKPVATRRNRIALAAEDAEWFVESAFHFDKQRSRLYPDGVDTLATAKVTNEVFIDNASIGFGALFGARVPRHLKRCIFFQQMGVPHKFRTVSSMLKDDDLKRDTKTTVIAWLRQAVQYQINKFRKEQRKSCDYKCALCAVDLSKGENHVDHGVGMDSFKEIAKRFQETNDVTVANLKSAMCKKWRRFHQRNANLSMTCRSCNLTNK